MNKLDIDGVLIGWVSFDVDNFLLMINMVVEFYKGVK